MNRILRPLLLLSASASLAGLAGAATPSAIASAEGGLWELSISGKPPLRLCVASPVELAQVEHRQASCSSQVVRDSGTSATIHYTCPGGGYGHSSLTLLTPRSLRVETQGIADNAPFQYTFQARRVGTC